MILNSNKPEQTATKFMIKAVGKTEGEGSQSAWQSHSGACQGGTEQGAAFSGASDPIRSGYVLHT